MSNTIEHPTLTAVRWERHDDGVVVLTLDDPGQSANTMNADYVSAMEAAVQWLRDEVDRVAGVVIISAKDTFFAGGDLREILRYGSDDAAIVAEQTARIKGQLRSLETLGRPVVAAIGGAALGGGLEIALSAHHRIAADVRGTVVGLPEVGLGLLPGGGGIVRAVRMLGLNKALSEVLLTGRRFSATEALALGLINEVVADRDALLPAAKAWIAAHPGAAQPWDGPKFRIPGGAANDQALRGLLAAIPSTLRKQLRGVDLPAPRAIIAAAVEGAEVDFDTACIIETRYFVSLATGKIAKNLIAATFFDPQAVNAGLSRPADVPVSKVARLGILGAGLMGAGIAYAAARAGIPVVLKDLDLAAATRGKQYSEKVVARAVTKGTMTLERGEALLGLITPTADVADLAEVDFVVEAVFESMDVKRAVLHEAEQSVLFNAVLGSNTSSLPITELAASVSRPTDFIGIHFFSPAERMPLVELICGVETSDETIARAFDFARQIGKTPIVVNDGRGFFTTRVIGAALFQALAAVGEGVPAASIEQAALQAGYPVGWLQLSDELTLTLPQHVNREARDAARAAGEEWVPSAGDIVIDRMVDEFGRQSRKAGAGFYSYDEAGNRTGLWPGLVEAFGTAGAGIPLIDLKERMLFAEALEAVRALDDGILRSVTDGNVGSILGIGYPAWTGGVFQYINSFEGGPAGFVARADHLAERYGSKLDVPGSLRERARRGELYS